MKEPHSDSPWTHPICAKDYSMLEGGRPYYVVKDPLRETCCWCGEITREGIYYRFNPEEAPQHQ